VLNITGGGYAKLKERQGSKELLDPGSPSVNKMSPEGVDVALMAEPKVEQSSTTPGRQSVGLLAGTARLMKRAVATADRYKQFIDADVDTEAAPITSSDHDADGCSDESSDADEPKLSHQSRPDFQYTDTGRHSMKLPLPHVFTPSSAVTTLTTTTTTDQPAIQSRKMAVDESQEKRAVRQRPAKPDFSTHTSSANPFRLGKIMPPLSCNASSSVAASSCCNKVDVFGAAPFRKRALGPAESKAESADNMGQLDVFANVPFVRQQERVGKAASSVSPPATSSKAAPMPNPTLSSDGGTYSTFSPTDSHSASSLSITASGVFHQSSSGPMSASFVLTENVGGGGLMNIVNTPSSAVEPHSVETQELSAYVQQDSGPLLTSPPLSVVGKNPHAIWSGTVTGECLDPLSCSSKATVSYVPALPPDAGQSLPEEPQATEECYSSGSLKKGWLAKLRSDKESPTTAVANLGFSDDPDAMLPMSALPPASDLSFHEDMLYAVAEPKSPVMAGELNFLLPSGEGSHTLPKVGVKKHLTSHQHRVPPMPPETDSFSVTKKGIALL